jgi:peptidoglycan/xylan/chitin deacetylase (PgdA/CDA1 family)
MLVIYYHNVINTAPDEFDKEQSRMHVDEFAVQMKYLAKHFKPTSLDAMLAQLGAGKDDPECMVVTFDDGYYGVVAHALPVLRSLNIPATIFIVTDYARPREDFRLLHFDEIEVAFRLTELPTLDMEAEGLGVHPLTRGKTRVDSMVKVKKQLKLLPEVERQRLHRLLLEKLEVTPEQALSYARPQEKFHTLSWDEIREARSDGLLSIGSHTCTHRALRQLDVDEREAELVNSFERMQKELDMDSIPFAYPYGHPEHIGWGTPEMVKDAGYSCALTTVRGKNTIPHDPFTIRRLPPGILDLFV